jgi:hypothetical protein
MAAYASSEHIMCLLQRVALSTCKLLQETSPSVPTADARYSACEACSTHALGLAGPNRSKVPAYRPGSLI